MTCLPIGRLRTGLAALILSACGSSEGSAPPAADVITNPTTINLYPNQGSDTNGRLAVMITGVGSQPVSLPLGFDTGSPGVSIYAPAFLPASIVTPGGGFIFPSGATSIAYNGITITNQQGTHSYGSVTRYSDNGNIAYATLTFGDAQGQLTTQVMPVFLWYSRTYANGSVIEGNPDPSQFGWFGVASTYDKIVVSGVTDPPGGVQACSLQTQGTCEVVSALKYLNYGSSVNAGFMLAPASLQTCDPTVAGSCAPAPMLTVGLTRSMESGFSTTSLTCPPNGNSGQLSVAGYPVCGKTIPDVTIAVSGQTDGMTTNGALFDSGTADMEITPPAGASFPSAVAQGSTVAVTTPSGFTYSFTAGAGNLTTLVDSPSTGLSIIGVSYFTTNWFFIDFTSSSEGWK